MVLIVPFKTIFARMIFRARVRNMDNNHKYFIYTRKSTDDMSRQLRSIDDQIAELQELATRSGITPVKTFIEKQTAKKPGRPVFNDMLDRIERGEADGILAWHPDRLARNALDGGMIIQQRRARAPSTGNER